MSTNSNSTEIPRDKKVIICNLIRIKMNNLEVIDKCQLSSNGII